MRFVPQFDQIFGRRIEIVRTKSGLVLPDSQLKGVTKFMVIDAVGPDVTKYKVGQVILPHRFNFMFLRDGFTRALCIEKEVMMVVEDVPEEQIEIEGMEPSAAWGATG